MGLPPLPPTTVEDDPYIAPAPKLPEQLLVSVQTGAGHDKDEHVYVPATRSIEVTGPLTCSKGRNGDLRYTTRHAGAVCLDRVPDRSDDPGVRSRPIAPKGGDSRLGRFGRWSRTRLGMSGLASPDRQSRRQPLRRERRQRENTRAGGLGAPSGGQARGVGREVRRGREGRRSHADEKAVAARPGKLGSSWRARRTV